LNASFDWFLQVKGRNGLAVSAFPEDVSAMDLPQSSFRRLEVWQVAMDLADACYRTTTGFPRREWYGLAAQIRRAAVSVPSNVAEGHCRRSRAAYAYHLSVALGSHA